MKLGSIAAAVAPLVLLPLSSLAAAPRPAELVEGMAGVSGYQEAGVLFDRVVITVDGVEAMSSRLRLRDRAAEFDGFFGAMPVTARCATVNGLVLAIDCRILRSADDVQVAHLRIPLY